MSAQIHRQGLNLRASLNSIHYCRIVSRHELRHRVRYSPVPFITNPNRPLSQSACFNQSLIICRASSRGWLKHHATCQPPSSQCLAVTQYRQDPTYAMVTFRTSSASRFSRISELRTHARAHTQRSLAATQTTTH